MKREVKIGIFLAGVMIIAAGFIFIVGDLAVLFKKPGYELSVFFPSATGLENRAAVRLAGVKIGYVGDIRLAERKAQVILKISPEYQIPRGSLASLASLGLIGERYIEIKPSEEKTFCAPGERLEPAPSSGFDQLGDQLLSIGDEIKEVSRSLRRITNEESQKNMQEILQNLNSFTRDLEGFLRASRNDLQTGIRGASETAQQLNQRVGEVSKGLGETVGLIKEIAEENRGNLKLDLEKISSLLSEVEESLRLLRDSLEKIKKGEGTIGRLVQDPSLYEEAEETLGTVKKAVEPLGTMRAVGHFRADYLGRTQKTKTYLSAGFYLSPRAFLLGQVVEDPRLGRFTYSAQAGVRFGPLRPRAGIIESEFGAGVDCLALRDRLSLSLEGYDFRRDGGLRLRFTTQYALLSFVHLILGVDDLGLERKREVYFGLGLGTR
jgi:phospholipid/cholesterol/gamma-HCH transport system substrate-binding protein